MPDSNTTSQAASFFARVIRNESAKKGVAAAAAGVLIAVFCEALWPNS